MNDAVVYPGIDGFLGTRASLMLDLVFLAMFLVLPLLGTSIYLVRVHRRFEWHKRLQLMLAGVLLVTVALFEVDMRLHGWQERAKPSPYYGSESEPGAIFTVLYVHLFFAVTTTVLWTVVIVRALRQFPSPLGPGPHSRSHVVWARLAALDMVATSLTGWVFYWLAFVASAGSG